MDKKIITSLYAYNYSLFVAYLDGSIDVFPLPEYNSKLFYPQSHIKYQNKIETNSDLIIGMQAKQHILFAATTDQLFSFNLDQVKIYNDGYFKSISGCQRIIINHNNNILYVITKDRGIVAINIQNAHRPKFINDMETSVLNGIEDGAVSGLNVIDNSILLSIRNRGIFRIIIDENNKIPSIEREITKIQLEDVQDIIFEKRNRMIYALDSERGFLIINTTNNQVEFERKLPDGDTPKSILLYNNNALIRGGKGLYSFDPKSKNILKILDKKIGAVLAP